MCELRNWRRPVIQECDGGAAAAPAGDAGGAQAAPAAPAEGPMTTTGDVLGKCDHVKDGYMGDGCFHIPSKAKVPLHRFEIANGGSVCKNKRKKTAYEKGMKVVVNMFESGLAAEKESVDPKAVNRKLKAIASGVNSMADVKKAAADFDKGKVETCRKIPTGLSYQQLKQLFLDFGQFAKDVSAGRWKASWFAISMVAVGLIYIISPVDLIPDAIPVVGWLDDAYVLKLIYGTVKDEFEAWRRANKTC